MSVPEEAKRLDAGPSSGGSRSKFDASDLSRASILFEEKVREFSVARRIGEALKYTQDARRVFEVILDTIIEETKAHNCSLMLYDRESGELTLRAARGQDDPATRYYPIPERGFRSGEGAAGWVAQRREILSIPDIGADERFVEAPSFSGKIRSLLCAPLVVDQELVGVVNMSHADPGAFRPEDERILGLVTGQVAVALHNVQVFEDLRRLNLALEERVALTTESFKASNLELQREISERMRVEGALQGALEGMEARVRERTTDLETINLALQSEILERKRVENELRESERTNRALVNAIPDLLFRIHRDGTCLFFKGSKEVGLFMPPGRFLGRKMQEILPPGLTDQALLCVERALQTDEAQFLEYQLPIEGESREFEARFTASGADEVLVIIRDITLKKRSIEALQASEAEYRSLVESLHEGIGVVDRSERFTFVNRAASEIMGRSVDEVIGKSLADLTTPEGFEQIQAETGIRMSGVTSHYETSILRKDGERRDIVVTASPILGQDGQYEGAFGIFHDVTEQRRAEEARRAAERELAEQQTLSLRSDRLRSLGEMAAGIAHELNQPLTGIRGFAEFIQISLDRGWALTPEKLRDRVARIVEQADRMTHIIEHVRMFSREAGRPEVRPVSVNEVARSAMDLLMVQFQSRGMDLASDLAEGLPPVSVNPFSLEEVLLNLLVNARDAVEQRLGAKPHPTDEAAGRVVLRTKSEGADDGRVVLIEVIDRGGGIPEAVLPRVFEPFFTTKGLDKGTGLGLPISKSIVEQFGGGIEILSIPGEGTTVTVRLPVTATEEGT